MSEQQTLRRYILARAILVSAVVTIICTVGTLYFLSVTPLGEQVRSRLGLENLKTFNIQTTRTQKVVVEESSAIIDATKKIQPAVVSVTGTQTSRQNIFGFGNIQAPTIAGTGFVVTSDGLIVTNKHVVSGAADFTVTTNDGKNYPAKAIAQDPTNDIALLKIEAKGLPVVDFGEYDKLQVGQWVIAVGNALGELQNTVTVGVVSAKERTVSPSDGQGNSESLFGLIQTDAAINSGNSGGPLVNLAGQVIGMNTAMSANANSIGFAIPATDIQKDLEIYRKNGKIVQPQIGVSQATITSAIAKSNNLPVDQGAYVQAVGQGTAAASAGLQAGDIITKINNDQINESNPLIREVRKFNPGDKISLTVLRDGKEQIVSLTLGQVGG